MNKEVRETSETWDDVPAKVVGRRRPPTDGWRSVTVLQEGVNRAIQGRTSWPKGVYRFGTFEEADAWWSQKTAFRSRK